MATKGGMTSAPAKGIRVSAGIYKDAKGNQYRSSTGAAPSTPKTKPAAKAPPKKKVNAFTSQPDKRPGLSADENRILDNQQTQDLGLQRIANKEQLPGVADAYSTPYDYQGPAAGVADPAERKRIEDETFNAWQARDSVQTQQENDDLSRWSQATGNDVNSPAYQAKAQQLASAQNDRRVQEQSQVTQLGGTEEQRAFDMANTAHQTGITDYQTSRDRPLQEYAATTGLVQGVAPAQQLASQTTLNTQQGNIARGNALATIAAQKAASGAGRRVAAPARRVGKPVRRGGMVTAPQPLPNTGYTVVPGIQAPQPTTSSGNGFSGFLGNVGGAILNGAAKNAGNSIYNSIFG